MTKACIHSAVAPNMNRCVVCGMTWTGKKWEYPMTDTNTSGGADVLAVMYRIANGDDLGSIDGHDLHEAADAVAALIEREAALETDLARVSEELGLQPKIGPAPGVIRALVARNAELEAERDALRKACVAVLDSSPKNICHRNAKEREAYKAMRRALGWPEGRHGH